MSAWTGNDWDIGRSVVDAVNILLPKWCSHDQDSYATGVLQERYCLLSWDLGHLCSRNGSSTGNSAEMRAESHERLR